MTVRQALDYVAIAAFGVTMYAQLRPLSREPVRTSIVEPPGSLDWIEGWYAAPVVTVTADDILFQGQLIAKVQSLYRDSPMFRLEPLEDRLRQVYRDLDPQSPHARLRAGHSSACKTAELERTDRRILCAGRFVVVELAHDGDRRALGQIINSIESLGFYVVLTFMRPT
jgi:hypothetical protein